MEKKCKLCLGEKFIHRYLHLLKCERNISLAVSFCNNEFSLKYRMKDKKILEVILLHKSVLKETMKGKPCITHRK